MELKCEIKVFGVADIIQLISQQQKTGFLCVEKELGGKAEISFLNGFGQRPGQFAQCQESECTSIWSQNILKVKPLRNG